MKFNTYKTHYDIFRETLPKKEKDNMTFDLYKEHIIKYKGQLFGFKDQTITTLLLAAEINFICNQRPYYNVSENIIKAASRMKVDTFGVDLLALPKNDYAVAINLPQGYGLKSILAMQYDATLTLFMDYVGAEHFLSFSFKTNTEKTVQDILKEAFERCKTVTIDGQGIVLQALQLFIMCKFLTDNPNELIEFDVIKKVKGEYTEAKAKEDTDRMKSLEDISRAHGKNGYNIGVATRLIENVGRLTEPREPGNRDKYEHEFAHIRTGHLHAVRCGEGKKNVKIMWFRPTIVGEGKPFKSSQSNS